MPKMIQLRHVPDDIHRKLKARAAMMGMSLSDYLLAEVQTIAERPTPAEMKERLARRPSLSRKVSLPDLVRAERDGR